jgi:hypothetical protein
VLEQWRQQGDSKKSVALDNAALQSVTDAALAKGDLPLAVEMLERRPDDTRIALLIKEASRQGDSDVARRAALIGIRRLVAQHEWRSIVKVAESADFGALSKSGGSASLRPLLQASGGEHAAMGLVLDELARSADLSADSSSGQGPVTEYLHRTFVRKGFAATAEYGVPVSVAGAAIERAGRILDAIQYYEAILGDKRASDRDRAFSAERMVRSLERHAEYLRARGEEPQARRQEARAKQVRDTTGLKGRRVPDFPNLDRDSLAGSIESMRGPFRIVSSPVHQRLRIENTDRFETVTVDGHALTLRGDVAVEASNGSADGGATWLVPAWNASVRLQPTPCGLRVEIRMDGQTSEVLLPKAGV